MIQYCFHLVSGTFSPVINRDHYLVRVNSSGFFLGIAEGALVIPFQLLIKGLLLIFHSNGTLIPIKKELNNSTRWKNTQLPKLCLKIQKDFTSSINRNKTVDQFSKRIWHSKFTTNVQIILWKEISKDRISNLRIAICRSFLPFCGTL